MNEGEEPRGKKCDGGIEEHTARGSGSAAE